MYKTVVNTYIIATLLKLLEIYISYIGNYFMGLSTYNLL